MDSPFRVVLVVLLMLLLVLAAFGLGLTFMSGNEMFMKVLLTLLTHLVPLAVGLLVVVMVIVFATWHFGSMKKAGIAENWWLEKVTWLADLTGLEKAAEQRRDIVRIFQTLTGARWVMLYEYRYGRETLAMCPAGTEPHLEKDGQPEFLVEESVVKLRDTDAKKQPCFELNNIPNSLVIRDPFQGQMNLHLFPLALGKHFLGLLVAGIEIDTRPLEKGVRRYLETATVFISSLLYNHRLETKLDREALTDPSTGCFRYRFLSIFLEREIDRAERTQKEVAVLLVEPDAGEKVMIGATSEIHKDLVKAISTEIRGMDMIFKDASTGFYLILLGETDEQEVVNVAGRIQQAVSRKKFYDPEMGLKLDITARLGAALYPTDATLPANLLEMANQALSTAREKNMKELARYAS